MTQHVSNSPVTFVTQAICCPLLSAILLCKLTIKPALQTRLNFFFLFIVLHLQLASHADILLACHAILPNKHCREGTCGHALRISVWEPNL